MVTTPSNSYLSYAQRLQQVLAQFDWAPVARLAQELDACWRAGRHLFLCGNGGSAANAQHLANDFLYGIGKPSGQGLRVTALTANSSAITCLANDLGYDHVFSAQLNVLGQRGDVLMALSGSGRSANIVAALQTGRRLGLRTAAILGYDGGPSRELADIAVHFPIDDMQIAEDLQLITGHMLMQELHRNPPARGRG